MLGRRVPLHSRSKWLRLIPSVAASSSRSLRALSIHLAKAVSTFRGRPRRRRAWTIPAHCVEVRAHVNGIALRGIAPPDQISMRTCCFVGRVQERQPGYNVAAPKVRRLRDVLLRWSGENGRHFFWRDPTVTPFEVLVTEILLAKTRAELVAPIARELLDTFRSAADLAAADTKAIERRLYPLGLHRKRAKHLIACAKTLLTEFDGEVPGTVEQLMQLPFVGRYAANAVACVAFGQAVPVIDANVSRIYRRVFSLPEPPERLALAHDLWRFGQRVLPRDRAKEFNWAILDLGGTVCTAKTPACDTCPLRRQCAHALQSRRAATS
jgi:A/G-specific adenine glycosylase